MVLCFVVEVGNMESACSRRRGVFGSLVLLVDLWSRLVNHDRYCGGGRLAHNLKDCILVHRV
jgi:hypothetical protein